MNIIKKDYKINVDIHLKMICKVSGGKTKSIFNCNKNELQCRDYDKKIHYICNFNSLTTIQYNYDKNNGKSNVKCLDYIDLC